MSIFEHSRWEICHQGQHPFRHPASDFSYTHASLPGVTTIEAAFNWILAVLYPNVQDAVADVASLPAAGNTINDYRVVTDDGDGKAAAYRWEQREGDVAAKWYKVGDLDWGAEGVISQYLSKTQDLFVYKSGHDDLDSSGVAVTGTLAGQAFYGGASASTNLTLFANSGDGVGATTGYVQVGDNFRPTTDSAFNCGSNTERWLNVYTDSLTSGTLVATTGSITCASGAISFGDENLTTTGIITGGVVKADNIQLDGNTISILDVDGNLTLSANGNGIITSTFPLTVKSVTATTDTSTLKTGSSIGTLTFADGSITDSSGTISFGDENLTTTGTVTGGVVKADNLQLDGNTLSVTDTDGNLILEANGTGVISLSSSLSGGVITGTEINADNLRLDGNTLSSTDANGNVILDPNGSGLVEFASAFYPTTNSAEDIGKTGNVWNKLWIDGSIGDTSEITIDDLLTLRNVPYRDAARTQAVQAGDALFWDAVSGTWLASAPDSEIDHGTLAALSLADDDHTQYVLLAGRADGQTINGGANASGNLTLESTANASKGNIIFSSILRPSTDGTLDIGTSSYPIQNLYISGQLIEARLENQSNATAPSASAGTKGRLYFNTDENDIFVDVGGSWIKVNAEKYYEEDASSWDGSTSTHTYTVSGSVSDARKCIWSFYDNANSFEELGVKITKTQTQVTVTSPVNLPVGTYTLIGIG